MQQHAEVPDDEPSDFQSAATFANLVDRLEKLEEEEDAGNEVPEFSQFKQLISEMYGQRPEPASEVTDDFYLGDLYADDSAESEIGISAAVCSEVASELAQGDSDEKKAQLEAKFDELKINP